MKLPKTRRRYCPKCRRHTVHTISLAKKKERGSLKHGSIKRARKRGLGRGYGNLGKWGSKPAISKFKRAGAKISKHQDLRFKCKECGKTSTIKKAKRAKKIEFK